MMREHDRFPKGMEKKQYSAASAVILNDQEKEKRMEKKILAIGICLLWALVGSGAIAQQGLIVYPAKGQSQEQMEKDKFDCYQWATADRI